jgi:Tol biopolymer transport system component
MSPEQAKGRPVDKRADIWAFGCVLYEMVTGRRAFAGEDVSDTLASVLRADVDWTGVPHSIVRLLKRCLERDPRKRLHDIGDVWDLLDQAPAGGPALVASRVSWLAWSVTALLAMTTAALAWLHFTETTPVPGVVRFQIPPPANTTFDIYLTLSPDGRRLAFTARDEKGVVRLWIRDLDAMDARALPGTEQAWGPFWSPDGRYLAFSVDRQLKRIDVSGGPPQTVCVSPNVVGTGAWHQSGVILFGTRGSGGDAVIRRVPASGGDPVVVTSLDATRDTFHAFPSFLPDGRHFLYLRQSARTESQGFYVGTVDALPDQQPLRRVVDATFGPAQVVQTRSGARILFVRDANLMAQAFDLDRFEVVGDAVPLAERLGSSGSFAFLAASAAAIAYRSGSASATNTGQLTWVNRQGETIGKLGEPRGLSTSARALALSPDGLRALMVTSPTAGQADVWLADLARDTSTRFTFEDRNELEPVWSPDGRRVAYRGVAAGALLIKDASGSTAPIAALESPELVSASDWSPDGRWLLVIKSGLQLETDLWILPLDGDKNLIRLTETPFAEPVARFSPDGRWVAYQSNETGRPEIYIRPFHLSGDGKPGLGAPWLVSTDGGVAPRWRRDGREIFYRTPAGDMMAADVSIKADALTTARPRQLFSAPAGVTNWDVAPDGQRFLLAVPVLPAVSDPVSVVLNWSQLLGL